MNCGKYSLSEKGTFYELMNFDWWLRKGIMIRIGLRKGFMNRIGLKKDLWIESDWE